MASPLANDPTIAAFVAAIRDLEAALPGVSPSSDTPDVMVYGVVVQTLLQVNALLDNVRALKASAAANSGS
jgi:hypothetical protein